MVSYNVSVTEKRYICDEENEMLLYSFTADDEKQFTRCTTAISDLAKCTTLTNEQKHKCTVVVCVTCSSKRAN